MPTPHTPPPHMTVPEVTNTPSPIKLPDATQNVLLDKTSRNKDLPDKTDKTAMDDIKPIKGVFKTKRISIRRSKDPLTF